jgi:hypothetical protein
VLAASRDAVAELLADCHDDPGLFHEAVLGRLPLHAKQEEIATSVVENRVTVVPAAHGVGKSWYAASAALHWLYTRPGAKVVTTSASNTQLVTVLWGAIKTAHRASRIPLQGRISDGHAIPQRLELGPEWYAIGWSAKRPESFSGIHGGEILVIADESSGIDDAIFDAIESLGYSSLLLLGNPIRATGHFKRLYELATSGEPGYRGIHLTAFDSPHATMTDAEVKAAGLPRGLTTKTWIDRVRRVYGEGSLYWVTRVLARFPDQDHDQLLSAGWVDRCQLVDRVNAFADPCLILDLSKGTGRDRTVIVAADYLGIRELAEDNRIDLPSAAVLARQWQVRYGVRSDRVVYDAGGWAGSDFARHLEQVGIHGATGYRGSDGGGSRFANQRSRSAWRLRQRLTPDRPIYSPPPIDDSMENPLRRLPAQTAPIQPPFHIPAGPYWPELRQELLELRYRHTLKKLALELKEDLSARLGRSPDLADAMIMLASLWPDDE